MIFQNGERILSSGNSVTDIPAMLHGSVFTPILLGQ